jgi:hypothetical protein
MWKSRSGPFARKPRPHNSPTEQSSCPWRFLGDLELRPGVGEIGVRIFSLAADPRLHLTGSVVNPPRVRVTWWYIQVSLNKVSAGTQSAFQSAVGLT